MACPTDNYLAIYQEACGNDEVAYDFILGWNRYVHEIDDFIDGPDKDPQKLLDILAIANAVYSCEFYQAHSQAFRMAVMLITNAYADSLEWEAPGPDWKRQWADTLRFAGNEMVLSVAAVCGGHERMRAVSLKLREDSWNTHHDHNNPT